MSTTLGMSPVLPPDLDLLPGERVDQGNSLHLLHGQEGQVVEPPGQDGHCVPAVRTPGLPHISLTLGPHGELYWVAG